MYNHIWGLKILTYALPGMNQRLAQRTRAHSLCVGDLVMILDNTFLQVVILYQLILQMSLLRVYHYERDQQIMSSPLIISIIPHILLILYFSSKLLLKVKVLKYLACKAIKTCQ